MAGEAEPGKADDGTADGEDNDDKVAWFDEFDEVHPTTVNPQQKKMNSQRAGITG